MYLDKAKEAKVLSHNFDEETKAALYAAKDMVFYAQLIELLYVFVQNCSGIKNEVYNYTMAVNFVYTILSDLNKQG